MSNIGLGLELMLIGMSSVFVILIIVILLGKLMIKVTNRFSVEETAAAKPAAAASAISSETRSIIEATVRELTGGKGTVKEIVKL